MAKQTLDLFKLFKLVVEKGGLVEVSDAGNFRFSIAFVFSMWWSMIHRRIRCCLFFFLGYKQENLA